MFQTDTTIESACRVCGDVIKIGTAQTGKALGYCHPSESVIWYDFAYSQIAAASCCPAITFFCSDEHQQRWLLAQSPQRIGCRLTLDEALEVVRALFETVLVGASTG